MTNFYNANGQQMTPAAYYALDAALRIKTIGKDAAYRYGIKRGTSVRLIVLARQLLAAEQIKELDFTKTQAADLPLFLKQQAS